ncbi:MAG: head-tail adaptor protein [Cellulosilyticum sp.]|nr:head-tail adaptor protein [Cellulosilyticum sp.]
MQCGEMKHKIDICIKSVNSGPFGGNGYDDVLTSIWAKKEELIGTQLYQAMGESDKIPCNFIIRRNDSVTNDMYVRCGNKMYDIKSAVPLPKNDSYTILSCYEIEG